MPSPAVDRKAVALAVVVAALGYFVDIYDLILFGVVRKPSLAALGVAPADMQAVGERLLNYQMIGMLLGGVVWGVLGDKRGRLSVLFGSIITYSLANIANGFVGDVDTYAWLRLIAGVGLAGELGAGITLVSELVPARSRGWATTIVATVGIAGGVVATLVGDAVHWRTAYYIGGGLGLALLGLRLGVRESAMFAAVRGATHVGRGRILALIRTPARLRRYLTVILIGVPIWYVVGILVFFSAEIGGALGVTPAPRPAEALRYCYAGLAVGDLASGALSQVWRSRRKAIAAFLALTTLGTVGYFTVGARSGSAFLACCAVAGLGAGYWAVFVTSAAEQFGTNLRATVTTTAPNVVRGAMVPMTFAYAKARAAWGIVPGAIAVGVGVLALAVGALALLDETHGRDLDFVDDDA